MKNLVLITAIWLAALPATAQSDGDVEEGFDLMGEGIQLLLRGLMSEMEPALRDLEGAMDSFHGYHAPEILPNGDILIRRKQPGEEALPPVLEEGEEIEI